MLSLVRLSRTPAGPDETPKEAKKDQTSYTCGQCDDESFVIVYPGLDFSTN